MNYILVFLASSGISAIFLPRRYDTNKRQPKIAGVVLAFALIASLVLSYVLGFVGENPVEEGAIDGESLVAIAIGSFLFLIVGVLNDQFRLRRWHQVAGQFLGILIVIPFGLSKATSLLPIGLLGATIGVSITILWFLGVTNALSLLSNSSTLVGVISLIIGCLSLAISLIMGSFIVACVSIALIGGLVIFLAYSRFLKCFPFFQRKREAMCSFSLPLGSCGEMFLGFILAAVPILLLTSLL